MLTEGRSLRCMVIALLVAALGAACSSSPPAKSIVKVEVPGGAHPFSTAIKSVPTSRVESFGSLMICALRPRSQVVITAVTLPPGATGLTVIDFGTRPNPFLRTPPGESFGVEAGSVASHNIVGTVVYTCAPPSAGTQGRPTSSTELVVAVKRAGSITGITTGLVVHYRTGGQTGTATFPEGITLCSPEDTQTSGCD
jgi:hypothetical protein